MSDTQAAGVAPSPWMLPKEAAAYARCSLKSIYRAVERGRLRHARVGDAGRALRFRAEHLDAWLESSTTPREVVR